MYCPKCSQIQTEDGLRFCSRCGFQLGVVRDLLAEGDSAQVVTAGSQVPPKFFSRRKQDLLFGATLMSVAATIVVQLSWVAPKALIIFPLWMIPRAKAFVVIRSGTTLATDASAYFSSDRGSSAYVNLDDCCRVRPGETPRQGLRRRAPWCPALR